MQDILGSIDGIAFVRFGHEDVVRHKLVQRIVEAYRQHAEETGTRAAQVTPWSTVEVENRSGVEVDERGRRGSARRVLAAEGIDDGELGLALRRAGRDAAR